jgi:hypothetical protein
VLSILVMLGLLSAGLEGAVDAVRIAHDPDPSAPHEGHDHHSHPAPSGDPNEHGDGDSGGHAHTCHCGLHVPPLAPTVATVALSFRHVRPLTEPTLHASSLGPPPLPPPIA